MSAEPKRDLAEILDRLLPPGGLARTAARHSLMKELAGWVSPEEATAREAAARREALLEAADLVAPLSGIGMGSCPTRSEWSEWLRDRAAALAEPERAEESGR